MGASPPNPRLKAPFDGGSAPKPPAEGSGLAPHRDRGCYLGRMDERKRIEELRQKLLDMDLEILRTIERRARTSQDLSKLRSGSARYAPVTDGVHLAALEKAAT